MSMLRTVLQRGGTAPLQSVGRLAFTPAAHLQASSFASSSRVGLDFTRPRLNVASSVPPTEPSPASPTASTSADAATAQQDVASAASAAPRAATTISTPRATTIPMTRPPPGAGGRTGRGEIAPEANALDRAKADSDNITHTLTVTSTRNNVFLTFADQVGPVFPTITAGTGQQFKNSQRSSHEAAHQATLKVIERILGLYRTSGRRDLRVRVAFKGVFGLGREAVAGCLGGNDGVEIRRLIARVEDRTPFKIGGTRAPKVRRL